MNFYLQNLFYFFVLFFIINYLLLKVSAFHEMIQRVLLIFVVNRLNIIISILDKTPDDKSATSKINKPIIFEVLTLATLLLLISFPRILMKMISNLFSSSEKLVISEYNSNWLKITEYLYSKKAQKEVFEPIASDWGEEYFEALFKKEIWKVRWINVRYTYAFLAAIWMKSPIGDLIQFVIKIAKG